MLSSRTRHQCFVIEISQVSVELHLLYSRNSQSQNVVNFLTDCPKDLHFKYHEKPLIPHHNRLLHAHIINHQTHANLVHHSNLRDDFLLHHAVTLLLSFPLFVFDKFLIIDFLFAEIAFWQAFHHFPIFLIRQAIIESIIFELFFDSWSNIGLVKNALRLIVSFPDVLFYH